eukprot:jgi/Tetstr1/449990/TSEL_037042.t1
MPSTEMLTHAASDAMRLRSVVPAASEGKSVPRPAIPAVLPGAEDHAVHHLSGEALPALLYFRPALPLSTVTAERSGKS